MSTSRTLTPYEMADIMEALVHAKEHAERERDEALAVAKEYRDQLADLQRCVSESKVPECP